MKNINLWETARREKIFPEKVREKMRDLKKEFILEKGDVSGYKLTEIHTFKQEIRLEKRQPGEPVSSYIEVYNPIFAQPVRFIIQSKSETISQIKIKIDQIREIVLPVDLNKGEIIKYTGSNEVIVYNKNWKIIQKLPISNDVFMIQKGEHTIEINGQFESDEAVSIQVEFQLLGETEILQ
jgi:hypothetical protein